MTNIEALVTDLETSRQLHKAGIKFETAFVWLKNCGLNDKWTLSIRSDDRIKKYAKYQIIPAFTPGELMQVLPKIISDNKKFRNCNHICHLYIGDIFGIYKSECETPNGVVGYCYYASVDGTSSNLKLYTLNSEIDITICKALAKLCLWCKKEGYL